MRSVLKIRGGEDEEAEVEEEEEAVNEEEDEEDEVDDEEDEEEEEEEDEAPVSGFDYAAFLQKALDITKEFVEVTKVKVFPMVSKYVLKLRGGEDEEAEGEEGDDDDEEEEKATSEGIDYNAIIQKAVDVTKEVYQMTKVKVFPVVSKYSVKGAVTAKKTSITVYKAIRRAISAAFEKDEEDEDEDDDDDDEEGSTALDKVIAISKKTVAVVKRMVKAAMTVPEDEASVEEDEEEVTAEDAEEETTTESEPTEAEQASDSPATDFGAYLSEGYGVDDERNSGKGEGVTILGGSLADALQTARQEARMLLAFIPADKPEGERGGFFGRRKGSPESDEADKVAIESLLSPEVSKAANRKSRKKGDGSGSFAIWGAKAGSPEAAAAIKQLKVKEISTKGDARPVMCVVYPPSVSFSSWFLPIHLEIRRYPLVKSFEMRILIYFYLLTQFRPKF